MNLEDIMLSEVRQSQKDTVCFHLHEIPRVVKFIEPESSKNPGVDKFIEPENCGGCLGLQEGGVGSSCLMGPEFQFEKMKVLELLVVVGVQNVNVLNAAELHP